MSDASNACIFIPDHVGDPVEEPGLMGEAVGLPLQLFAVGESRPPRGACTSRSRGIANSISHEIDREMGGARAIFF